MPERHDMPPMFDDARKEMCPFRLAVRDKGEWIHAILCVNEPGAEDHPDAILVSTFNKGIAEKDYQAFEEWHTSLQGFMLRAVQSMTGLEAKRVDTVRHHKTREN